MSTIGGINLLRTFYPAIFSLGHKLPFLLKILAFFDPNVILRFFPRNRNILSWRSRQLYRVVYFGIGKAFKMNHFPSGFHVLISIIFALENLHFLSEPTSKYLHSHHKFNPFSIMKVPIMVVSRSSTPSDRVSSLNLNRIDFLCPAAVGYGIRFVTINLATKFEITLNN